MKILGISGGRKDGNNDAMCKEALMAAKEMGAEVEFIHLLDLDIKYCIGYLACVGSLMTGFLIFKFSYLAGILQRVLTIMQ